MKQNYELARMAVAGLSTQDRVEFLRELTNAPAPVEPDRVLKVKYAAERMACTPPTIYSLLKSGALTRVRLPGRVRGCGVKKSEIDALIQGGGK